MAALQLAEAGARLQFIEVDRHETPQRDGREHGNSLGTGAKVLCEQGLFERTIRQRPLRGVPRGSVGLPWLGHGSAPARCLSTFRFLLRSPFAVE